MAHKGQSKRAGPKLKREGRGNGAPGPRLPRGAAESDGGEAFAPAEAGAGRLAPGLYLVATPIGNARDITLRALDVLRDADALAAEDTRQTRKLMEIHGIPLAGRPMMSYHDQNGPSARPRIARWLEEGRSVAYCTDAGSPLIADPGYRLAELAIEGDWPVTALPGASAVLTALPLSGLPSDRFLFAGFPPPKQGERRRMLGDLASVRATLVFYESPRRLAASLADMAGCLGEGRRAAVARELTKRHEEVTRDTLGALAAHYGDAPTPKGEIVVLVGPPEACAGADAESLDRALKVALARASVKDAARDVAEALGLPRRTVYARALELAGD